jgi:hypothetical protein
MEAIQYRGYTIEETHSNPYSNTADYLFYPTAQGRNDDYDFVNGDSHYCGNVQAACSLEDAKDRIWEIVMLEAYPTSWEVKHSDILPEASMPWLEDALRFSAMWNGMPLFTFSAP